MARTGQIGRRSTGSGSWTREEAGRGCSPCAFPDREWEGWGWGGCATLLPCWYRPAWTQGGWDEPPTREGSGLAARLRWVAGEGGQEGCLGSTALLGGSCLSGPPSPRDSPGLRRPLGGLGWEGFLPPCSLLRLTSCDSVIAALLLAGGSILCWVDGTPGPQGQRMPPLPLCFQRKLLASILTLALRKKLWVWMMDLGKRKPRGAVTSSGLPNRSYRAGLPGTALTEWSPEGQELIGFSGPLVRSGVDSPPQRSLSSPLRMEGVTSAWGSSVSRVCRVGIRTVWGQEKIAHEKPHLSREGCRPLLSLGSGRK